MVVFTSCFDTLPHEKILDWYNSEAFVDHKTNAADEQKFAVRSFENIEGKRENAGQQYILVYGIHHNLVNEDE